MNTPLAAQKSWGWRIATYLFLAGLGSGSTWVGIVYGLLFRPSTFVTKVGLLVGPPCVLLGCFFLFFDLGRPSLSYLILRRPKASWIARGFFILSGFILLGWVLILFWIGPWPVIRDWSSPWIILGCLTGVFALLTSIYPAFLLGCSPIPLWNTPILPVLFLVSSASMGISAIVLWTVHVLGLSSQEVSFLVHSDAFLIILELFLLFLYFRGIGPSGAAKVSARKILTEGSAPLFWGGVILVGLVIPFILELTGESTLLPGVSVLIGGYLLRCVIVLGGIKVPLSVHGVILPIPGKN